MPRESDIMHENGDFWVLRERKTYVVCRNVGTHSVTDSAYDRNPDGLSIAIARCDYLAFANPAKTDRSRGFDQQ